MITVNVYSLPTFLLALPTYNPQKYFIPSITPAAQLELAK
jgi:hypothetical protein